MTLVGCHLPFQEDEMFLCPIHGPVMQGAARSLSKQLPSPPIELALVEAAIKVFRLAQPSQKTDEDASLLRVAPAAVVTFLRRRVSILLFLSAGALL